MFKPAISAGPDCINRHVIPARLQLSEGATAHLADERPDVFPGR